MLLIHHPQGAMKTYAAAANNRVLYSYKPLHSKKLCAFNNVHLGRTIAFLPHPFLIRY